MENKRRPGGPGGAETMGRAGLRADGNAGAGVAGLRVGAVILAAGFSSRMGDFKPLLPLEGSPAIARLAATLRQAGVTELAAVSGYKRELLAPVLSGLGVREVFNPRFAEGMFTSIAAGVRAFAAAAGGPEGREPVQGALLLPVDCPAVSAETIRLLLSRAAGDAGAGIGAEDAHGGAAARLIAPCFRGKKGHPLFIPARYFAEILALDAAGGAGGLKAVTDAHDDELLRLETGDEGTVLDMDTREGYEEILQYLRRKREGEPAIDFRGRLFLVRHGETERHAEKIFLGQTDVPLSDEGRHQALNAGLKLAGLCPGAPMIYTSDLIRALETAEILRSAVHIAADGKLLELKKEPAFREMHLGVFEGRFIREVREEFPEEYEKRGRELLRWKKGHDGENFYDLQYRVMKAVTRILQEHSRPELREEDLILVAHSGVIKVILCNVLGRPLSEISALDIPRGSVTTVPFAGTTGRPTANFLNQRA